MRGPITEKELCVALNNLGIPPHIKGFNYLVYAFGKIYNENITDISLTGENGVQTAIATEFNTTSSKVERDLRHAVEKSFDNLSPELIYGIFGNTLPAYKDRPSIKHFVAAVANVLRYYPEKLMGGTQE